MSFAKNNFTLKVTRITLSDRASAGIYEDRSGPEIERILNASFAQALDISCLVLPDERLLLENELRRLADQEACPLILTTGGTGPSSRDNTPEATRAVLDKELSGFGEVQRMVSFQKVPTSILSRATAGMRKQSLIVNLPGNPKAIAECLPMLLPAMVECIDHLTGVRFLLKE